MISCATSAGSMAKAAGPSRPTAAVSPRMAQARLHANTCNHSLPALDAYLTVCPPSSTLNLASIIILPASHLVLRLMRS